MNDLIGVIVSIIFVIVLLGLSQVLSKVCKWSNEATRKFIHVGSAHWWIVAMLCIDSIYYAIIPPILFIILNYISYKVQWIDSMERDGDASDLGTVYFPISLVVLVVLFWDKGLLGNYKYIGLVGMMIMGYGDGFAAIMGKRFGKRKYNVFGNNKSIEGSLTVLVFAFAVTFITLNIYNVKSALEISMVIAILASLIEAVTPLGLDNITLPIITALVTFYFIQGTESTIIVYSNCAIGIMISSIIAIPAFYKKSLTYSGCVSAIVMGTVIYVTSTYYGILIMFAFFISSSALSHYKKNKKQECAKLFDKTGNRDALQVFANGGVGMIYSIIYYVTSNPIYLIGMSVAFAASNADTWATELGILNKMNPISIRTFKRVNKGTSGAISLVGTTCSFLGSAFIALISIMLIETGYIQLAGFPLIKIFLIVALGGFIGSIIDSIMGATVQGIYFSEDEQKETEKKIYNGKETKLIRGFEIFNNDIVNFLSIAAASAAVLAIL